MPVLPNLPTNNPMNRFILRIIVFFATIYAVGLPAFYIYSPSDAEKKAAICRKEMSGLEEESSSLRERIRLQSTNKGKDIESLAAIKEKQDQLWEDCRDAMIQSNTDLRRFTTDLSIILFLVSLLSSTLGVNMLLKGFPKK